MEWTSQNVIYHSFLILQNKRFYSNIFTDKSFNKVIQMIEKSCRCRIKTSLFKFKNPKLHLKQKLTELTGYLRTEIFYCEPFKQHNIAMKMIDNLFRVSASESHCSFNRLAYKTITKKDIITYASNLTMNDLIRNQSDDLSLNIHLIKLKNSARTHSIKMIVDHHSIKLTSINETEKLASLHEWVRKSSEHNSITRTSFKDMVKQLYGNGIMMSPSMESLDDNEKPNQQIIENISRQDSPNIFEHGSTQGSYKNFYFTLPEKGTNSDLAKEFSIELPEENLIMNDAYKLQIEGKLSSINEFSVEENDEIIEPITLSPEENICKICSFNTNI